MLFLFYVIFELIRISPEVTGKNQISKRFFRGFEEVLNDKKHILIVTLPLQHGLLMVIIIIILICFVYNSEFYLRVVYIF